MHCETMDPRATRLWVFDDTYDHELLWNRTHPKRVLLLVDIWHPDFMIAEKQEIVQLFQNAKQQEFWKR